MISSVGGMGVTCLGLADVPPYLMSFTIGCPAQRIVCE